MIKRRKAPRRKTPARKLKQQIDLIIKQKAHERDGGCVARGQAGVDCHRNGFPILQAAHILPKGKHQRLRFELDNVVSMCFFHHLIWAHRDPLAFAAFIHESYPGREERLRELDRTATKVDLKALLAELRLASELSGASNRDKRERE